MAKAAEMAIDLEWVELIMMAKRIGLTIEEIREFMKKQPVRQERAAAE